MNGYRKLEQMPYDKVFEVNGNQGNQELCHATGMELYENGEWWNEYVDSNGR